MDALTSSLGKCASSWALLGCLALVGCGDQPVEPASGAAAPNSGSTVEIAAAPAEPTAPAPRALNAKTQPPAPLAAEEPAPQLAPPPKAVREVRGSSLQDLERWLQSEQVDPEVSLAMLSELDAKAPALAVGAASVLAARATTDRHVRANAVALLARSTDPRAAEALSQLPARYRQLAAALRKTQ